MSRDAAQELVGLADGKFGSFWREIDAIHYRWNVLRHPFYGLWLTGELTIETLAVFAAEFGLVLTALAHAAQSATSPGAADFSDAIAAHAGAREVRVEEWAMFAEATGCSDHWLFAQRPLDETQACSEAWSCVSSETPGAPLITLFLVGRTTPLLAAAELGALIDHYGFAEGPATSYFMAEAIRRPETVLFLARAVNHLLEREDPTRVLDHAERVGQSWWRLLDGVEDQIQRC